LDVSLHTDRHFHFQIFPSYEKFKPERYLDDAASKASQSNFYFGFGRRICPGLHIAQNSLFVVIARYLLWLSLCTPELIVIRRILWAFDIKPSLDAKNRPILPSVDDFIGGLVIRPRPFPYVLAFRRSDEVRDVIKDQSNVAESEALAWM